MRSLEKEIDGDIIGHRMEIFITCSSCLAKSESNNSSGNSSVSI
jgi:hypothetical protein